MMLMMVWQLINKSIPGEFHLVETGRDHAVGQCFDDNG